MLPRLCPNAFEFNVCECRCLFSLRLNEVKTTGLNSSVAARERELVLIAKGQLLAFFWASFSKSYGSGCGWGKWGERVLVYVSSCWALSGEPRRRAPCWTALIPDSRRRQVKGDKGWNQRPPTTLPPPLQKSHLDQWPPPPPKTNRPTHLTSGSAPEAHGPPKEGIHLCTLASLPPSYFCLTFSISVIPYLTAIFPLLLCLSGWMERSVQKAARELQAGHDVPEALKWGVDLKCVQLVYCFFLCCSTLGTRPIDRYHYFSLPEFYKLTAKA